MFIYLVISIHTLPPRKPLDPKSTSEESHHESEEPGAQIRAPSGTFGGLL